MTNKREMGLSRRALLAAPLMGLAVGGVTQGQTTKQSPAPSGSLTLQRLSWAGVKLTVDTATVFIDAVPPDPDSGKPGPELAAGPGRNFALVTHHHTDHCDPKALAPVLGELGYIVCYQETARYLDTRVTKLQPVGLYEPVFLSRAGGEFVAFAVPAEDGLGSPQVSWVIDVAGRRMIHCGDTRWHGHLWDISRAYGPFDVALLPINGFRQKQGRYVDEGVPLSMTATEAVAAAHILKARTVIPIHYGSTAEDYWEDPNALQVLEHSAAAKGVVTHVLRPGESVRLNT